MPLPSPGCIVAHRLPEVNNSELHEGVEVDSAEYIGAVLYIQIVLQDIGCLRSLYLSCIRT